MQRTAMLLACLVAVLPVSAAAEKDELCARLRDFRMAPFDKDTEGKPLRRAIEFHWVGFWMDFEHGFGKQCHFGGTAPGKALCDWLPENTSTEFPAALPMGILTCYGWNIPAKVNDWDIRRRLLQSIRMKTAISWKIATAICSLKSICNRTSTAMLPFASQ